MKKLDFYFSKKAADNESQNVLSNSPSKDVNEPCTSFSQDVTAKKITLFDPPYPDMSSLTNVLEWLTAECIDKLYETYRHDLTDNQGTFNSEVQRWQRRWSSPDVIEKPKSLKASLSVTNKELYPSIFAIFAILVTMPVTTSTTERSFSSLRRLKTYLRSTMVQDRL
ncbi:unnamed protein product [Mytilus edulis]|uniref:HAT C-terminal dimerisation domain-containing protein n=1 Tax=Mytilus edulis TaxID=6550 RepID=A0A8S3RSS9_MYTED|nr:unnamed protein product [Mytilus edulis]